MTEKKIKMKEINEYYFAEHMFKCELCNRIEENGHDVEFLSDEDIIKHQNCKYCFWTDLNFGQIPFEFECDIEDNNLYGLWEYYASKLNGMTVCELCLDNYIEKSNKTINNYSKVISQLKYNEFKKYFKFRSFYISKIVFIYV
jgi:hypothetical protein